MSALMQPVANAKNCPLWTAEMVQERLREAIGTLNRLPFPRHGRPDLPQGAWPQIPSEIGQYWLNYGRDGARQKPAYPGPREIARMDECLPDWLMLVPADGMRQALFLRSVPTKSDGRLSVRRIAALLGVSRQTICNWEREALIEIVRHLTRRS